MQELNVPKLKSSKGHIFWCLPRPYFETYRGHAGPSQGGGLGGFSPPMFGQTVNPISFRGADYAPPKYYEPTQSFRPCDGPVMGLNPGYLLKYFLLY